MQQEPSPSAPINTASGTAFALAAYGLWGLMPAYWKQLAAIPAPELTAWRALCSAAFGIALLLILRRSHELTRVLRSARGALPIALSAALLGVNWLVFIRSSSDFTLDELRTTREPSPTQPIP